MARSACPCLGPLNARRWGLCVEDSANLWVVSGYSVCLGLLVLRAVLGLNAVGAVERIGSMRKLRAARMLEVCGVLPRPTLGCGWVSVGRVLRCGVLAAGTGYCTDQPTWAAQTVVQGGVTRRCCVGL